MRHHPLTSMAVSSFHARMEKRHLRVESVFRSSTTHLCIFMICVRNSSPLSSKRRCSKTCVLSICVTRLQSVTWWLR